VRSLPLILGISFGFLTMVLCIGLGVGEILHKFPSVNIVLKSLCGIYILWLSYKILKSRTLTNEQCPDIQKPFSFFQAAALQILNPKAWTVALIVTVTYTSPEHGLNGLLPLIALFAIINIPSISAWAISGAALRRTLSHGNRLVLFNIIMAVLLVGCMFPLLLQ